MGKKSLYLILSLTSAIVLFGISAICNFCSEQPASDDSLAGIETGTSVETVSDSIALSVEESEEAEPEASAPDFEEESSTPTVSEDTGEASSPEIHRVSLPRKDNESSISVKLHLNVKCIQILNKLYLMLHLGV